MQQIRLSRNAALLIGTIVAFLALAMSQAYADTSTSLEGSQEVPPVSSGVSGTFNLTNTDDASWEYTLDVFDGDEVTAAHLHCGDPGENGPAVVTLFSDPNGTDVDGRLTSGDIDEGDISAANCASTIGYDIGTLDDLEEAIDDGRVYVNVHTSSLPDGAARGQLNGDGNDGDRHKKDCDSRWGEWWKNHSNDSARWQDSDYWDDCKDYGYNDGKGDYNRDDSDSACDWDYKHESSDRSDWDSRDSSDDSECKHEHDYDHDEWNNHDGYGHEGHDGNDRYDGKDGDDGRDGRDGKDGRGGDWGKRNGDDWDNDHEWSWRIDRDSDHESDHRSWRGGGSSAASSITTSINAVNSTRVRVD